MSVADLKNKKIKNKKYYLKNKKIF